MGEEGMGRGDRLGRDQKKEKALLCWASVGRTRRSNLRATSFWHGDGVLEHSLAAAEAAAAGYMGAEWRWMFSSSSGH